jgi:Flp pilus assembly protein TadG
LRPVVGPRLWGEMGKSEKKQSPRAVPSCGLPGRFVRSTQAASAVEFGLIAAPFIALLLAILQVGVVLVVQQVLQTATTQTARMIMTGQVQNQNMTAAEYQQQLCVHATALFNCSAIFVNVQTFDSFEAISLNNPIQNGKFNSGGMQWSPGGPGEIVVAQTFYQWPVFLGPLGFDLANLNGNQLLLVGTAAFRVEPY